MKLSLQEEMKMDDIDLKTDRHLYLEEQRIQQEEDEKLFYEDNYEDICDNPIIQAQTNFVEIDSLEEL